jgi:hypothetical protein
MFCDCLRAIGLLLALCCGLAASAAETPTAAPSRAEAWGGLTRKPLEEDATVLTRAILDIVRARNPEDLDKLATYMQSEEFGVEKGTFYFSACKEA